MSTEMQDPMFGSNYKLIIGIIIGLFIGYFCGSKGVFDSDQKNSKETDTVVVEKTESVKPTPVATPKKSTTKTTAKRTETKSTTTPVANKEVEKKGIENKEVQTPALAKTPAKPQVKTGTEEGAVTMTNYSKDWSHYNAQISLKNNTDKNITSVKGRMIYYDMSDNMLDYLDFDKKVDIASGMVKLIELPGYNDREYFAYYKNETRYDRPNNKYKVEFHIFSYTYE